MSGQSSFANVAFFGESSHRAKVEENNQPLDYSLVRRSVVASSSTNLSIPAHRLPHSVANLFNLTEDNHTIDESKHVEVETEARKENTAPAMLSAFELMPPPRTMAAWRNPARPSQPHVSRPLFKELTGEMDARYQVFRANELKHMYGANGGRSTTNPNMSRAPKQEIGQAEGGASGSNAGPHEPSGDAEKKDVIYYERRRKNNMAAKKSRDRRRMYADETTIRYRFLKQENQSLALELEAQQKILLQLLTHAASASAPASA